MGADVSVCGPPTLIPLEMEKFGVKVFDDVDEALTGADVVNVLRIQKERQQGGLLPSLREYNRFYGITRERLKNLNENFTIMHPGPMNRGVEISSEVAEAPYSVILPQVTNGVAVRMAILYLLSARRGKVDEG